MQLEATHSTALANRVHTSGTWAVYIAERLSTYGFSDNELDDGSGATDGFAGLDDLGANADGTLYVQSDGTVNNISSGNDLYTVHWNVASDQPSVLRDVKRIRVHVQKNGGIGSNQGAPLYSQDFFIADSAF